MLRPMTGWEEELVEQSAGRNAARLLDELVARCSVAPGARADAERLRVRAMPTAVRDLALIELWRVSLGDRCSTQIPCPACGEINHITFSLADLPQAAPGVPGETHVAIEGVQAVLRSPTCGDQEDILDLGEARTAALLARVLVSYGERSGPFDRAFVEALPAEARSALDAALEEVIPELDLTMEVSCVECSHTFPSAFDVGSFFLSR